jgi:DNA-binding NarL/FixJ family response regulator
MGRFTHMGRTILIVDDHAAFRTAARGLLVSLGHAVVGEADSGLEALRLAGDLRPAIVLLDVALPDIDGFEVARRLAGTVEPPIVVLVSSRERDTYAQRLESAPVRGFLSKHQLSGPSLGALLG